MNCDGVRKLLGRLRDGEIEAGLAVEVRNHLSGCPTCQAEQAYLERLGDALRAEFFVPEPDGLAERAFQAAMAAGPTPRSFLATLLPMAWPVAVAATAAALVLVGWTLVASLTPSRSEADLLDGVLGASSSEQVQDVLQGALGLEADGGETQ